MPRSPRGTAVAGAEAGQAVAQPEPKPRGAADAEEEEDSDEDEILETSENGRWQKIDQQVWRL